MDEPRAEKLRGSEERFAEQSRKIDEIRDKALMASVADTTDLIRRVGRLEAKLSLVMTALGLKSAGDVEGLRRMLDAVGGLIEGLTEGLMHPECVPEVEEIRQPGSGPVVQSVSVEES